MQEHVVGANEWLSASLPLWALPQHALRPAPKNGADLPSAPNPRPAKPPTASHLGPHITCSRAAPPDGSPLLVLQMGPSLPPEITTPHTHTFTQALSLSALNPFSRRYLCLLPP